MFLAKGIPLKEFILKAVSLKDKTKVPCYFFFTLMIYQPFYIAKNYLPAAGANL